MSAPTVAGASEPRSFLPKTCPWNSDVFSLHLFLQTVLPDKRSYLPVPSYGRHHAFIDAKILRPLLKGLPVIRGVADGELLQKVFGACRETMASRRTQVRKKLRGRDHRWRKRWRNKGKGKGRGRGRGSFPKDAIVRSVETDGVSLCIHIERPDHWTQGPVQKAGSQQPPASSCSHPASAEFAGADTGRANLFVAAHAASGISKPTTQRFSRGRYYWEMGYRKQQAWVRSRQQQPVLAAAIQALSGSGGQANTSLTKWAAYLAAQQEHSQVLSSEYLEGKEYTKWQMRLYRGKRGALDRAVSRLLNMGDTSKPLALGIGTAGFASGDRGELSVPTTQLDQAFQRGRRRIRRTVMQLGVDEFRTTCCCCSCGRLTACPQVWDQKSGQWRKSRRFRLCTSVCHSPGGIRRHRDSQAATNILWCTISQFWGFERPCYLQRTARVVLPDEAVCGSVGA